MDRILSGMGLFTDRREDLSETKTKTKVQEPENISVDSHDISDDIFELNQEHRSQSVKAQPATSTSSLTQPNSPTPSSFGDRAVAASKDSSPSAVIGSKIRFKGELSGEEDLLIQGQVEGTVTLSNHQLTVGKLGNVKADLIAKNIIVDGRVEGDLTAEEHIAINASSIVKGNVIANRVTLEDGARFRGSIDMDLDNDDTRTSKTLIGPNKP